MKKGKVWLVGAGPYDEGLFTLKGKAVLMSADVVVYDHLVGHGILQMIPEHAKRIDVGKIAGNHKVVQEDINKILLEEAEMGLRVVRLKGGDPFLFGRGGEELELLRENNIAFEIVPGITSAIAVPAYAGIPVTHRDYVSSLHIITAHRKKGNSEPINYKSLAALGDATLVFLMGIREIDHICNGLMNAGMDPSMPAAVLEKGTSSKQRRVVATLQTLAKKADEVSIGMPGIIVVGKVCSLSKRFHWAEDRLLHGARIVITRPRDKNSTLSEKLYSLGAEIIRLPAIQTIPINIDKSWKETEDRISEYEWMVFTSAAAVEYFFEHLHKIRKDIRTLSGIRFAVVGKATKRAVESHGVFVDYCPDAYSGKALAEGLSALITKEKKVLLFVPKDTASDCAEGLALHNIRCDTITLYETVYDRSADSALERDDIVVFTSASTVRGFVKKMGNQDFSLTRAVCIGEHTAKEAGNYGMNISISREATIDSLIEKVIEVYTEIKNSRM
jgi:uroporphyrinogen III methyltransferase/synthase